nr:hypothetical protein [Thermogemmatispora sp.]
MPNTRLYAPLEDFKRLFFQLMPYIPGITAIQDYEDGACLYLAIFIENPAQPAQRDMRISINFNIFRIEIVSDEIDITLLCLNKIRLAMPTKIEEKEVLHPAACYEPIDRPFRTRGRRLFIEQGRLQQFKATGML